MTTLIQLRQRARDHTISRQGGPVRDETLSTWVDTAYRSLRMRLIGLDPNRFVTSTDATVDASGVADEPLGAYRIIRVDNDPGGSLEYSLPQISVQNEHDTPVKGWVYRGSKVAIVPQFKAAGTYRIWHIPGHTALVADDDEIDAHCVPFDEWIVLTAAIQLRQKAEEDLGALLTLRQDVEALIIREGQDRTQGSPKAITRRYRPLSMRWR